MSGLQAIADRARTKIVATVGPACDDEESLAELARAGVDVYRLNTAHGNREDHEAVIERIRKISREHQQPLGILVDLAGPKIRLGQLVEDPLECEKGMTVRFIRGDSASTADELTSTYEELIDELSPGDDVLLADGVVSLKVLSTNQDEAVCEVVGPGTLRSRQGINLPGVKLSVPSMTDEDQSYARWAAEHDADFVSLSFVRCADDIRRLKEILTEVGSKAVTVAKIEKREAMEALEEIVACADAVMVARGDLGVEIDVAETPVAQKRIIHVCQQQLKPVIVATQMLDSMQRSRRPTRAEATDVANAVLDGADACMLSGETAIGKYPKESVSTMNRILLKTEQMLFDAPPRPAPIESATGVNPVTAAVVYGANGIARQLEAALVVISTRSGATARVRAMQRNAIPSLGISDSEATLRRMCLYWGIHPMPGAPTSGPALREYIDRWGRESGYLKTGDRVVFVTGSELIPRAHNVVVVHEVEG